MTHTDFEQFITRHHWTFAKTYAAFCPHEYVVKDHLPEKDKQVFEQIALFIRQNGFLSVYGRKRPNRYYIVGDYYYWTMGATDKTRILNRAKLADFDFIRQDGQLICKYKFPKKTLS